MSPVVFCLCISNIDIADLRARTSGFESKSIGSGRGGTMLVCVVWLVCEKLGRFWEKGSAAKEDEAGGSGRLSGFSGGVIGLYGGRVGDEDRDAEGCDDDRDAW
jgi:hypothetical protein